MFNNWLCISNTSFLRASPAAALYMAHAQKTACFGRGALFSALQQRL
jgi:hypothetical protein